MPKQSDTRAAAFTEIALQHLDALYRYAMSLTRNEAESEDLVQETYLRALRASTRLRPGSNVKSWLFTILRNARRNQVQRPALETQPFNPERDLSATVHSAKRASDNPYFSYLSEVRRLDVQKAIDALPAAHREIIVLREFEDLSYDEIALILNCRPGTVMSRLARARQKLKQRLQDWHKRSSDSWENHE